MGDLNDTLTDPAWRWLRDRGWRIAPSNMRVGTARCVQTTRTIDMTRRAWRELTPRTIRYVLPHEICHAVHAETLNWQCDAVRISRHITWKSAVEVIADRWCLDQDRSDWMRRTVKASVVWHGRVGARYTLNDVLSPQAGELCALLREVVARG
jgi:hypothetical protein